MQVFDLSFQKKLAVKISFCKSKIKIFIRMKIKRCGNLHIHNICIINFILSQKWSLTSSWENFGQQTLMDTFYKIEN